MKIIEFNNINLEERKELLNRPAIDNSETLKVVEPIISDIKTNGLKSAQKYAKKIDGFNSDNIFVTENEFADAEKQVDDKLKIALQTAKENIEKFHKPQLVNGYEVETMPGIKCRREYRAIENVGLYIPGGTAVLPSTILMLAIPAIIAGCKRIVIISPVKGNQVNPVLLYTAKLCGITEFLKIGGAQGIALAAFGDNKIKKVDKIFGPGNQFVTAAKTLVSMDPKGAAIDMPAGPSEVLIIADDSADPAYLAADLLSQAEHGIDSQSVLVTTSKFIAEKTKEEVYLQLNSIDRKNYAEKSLESSFVLTVDSLKQAIDFSNNYAPEHLIVNTKDYNSICSQIENAGSVFLGKYTPESVGDYASGTNHSLPTYGYAKAYSGVKVEDFQKTITFQELSKSGLDIIAETVIAIAEAEKLDAHANAVKIRIQ